MYCIFVYCIVLNVLYICVFQTVQYVQLRKENFVAFQYKKIILIKYNSFDQIRLNKIS